MSLVRRGGVGVSVWWKMVDGCFQTAFRCDDIRRTDKVIAEQTRWLQQPRNL